MTFRDKITAFNSCHQAAAQLGLGSKVVLELLFWQPLRKKWQWGDLSREESARAGISHQAVIPDRAWHGEHHSTVLIWKEHHISSTSYYEP